MIIIIFMTFIEPTKREREELLALGLKEEDLVFINDLIAKKVIVAFEEMLARGEKTRSVAGQMKDFQNLLLRKYFSSSTFEKNTYQAGHFKGTYFKSLWFNSKGELVDELL